MATKPKQTAVTKDILINQGADFRMQCRLCTGTKDNYSPIDISDYGFRCVIRETAGSSDILAEAECTIIDADDGIMEVFFDNPVTAAIEVDGDTYDDTSEYVWDLYAIEPQGDTVRIVNGKCYVSPGVSFEEHE